MFWTVVLGIVGLLSGLGPKVKFVHAAVFLFAGFSSARSEVPAGLE
jgi:uncharacterized membrane protein YbaN (DUF454 family)